MSSWLKAISWLFRLAVNWHVLISSYKFDVILSGENQVSYCSYVVINYFLKVTSLKLGFFVWDLTLKFIT